MVRSVARGHTPFYRTAFLRPRLLEVIRTAPQPAVDQGLVVTQRVGIARARHAALQIAQIAQLARTFPQHLAVAVDHRAIGRKEVGWNVERQADGVRTGVRDVAVQCRAPPSELPSCRDILRQGSGSETVRETTERGR